MSRLAPLIIVLYTQILRLYPRQFCAEFGSEMQAVFALAVKQAEKQGVSSVTAVWLRELRDLPMSIIREHIVSRKVKSAMKWFHYDQTQEARIVRWLIRIVSLLASAFFFFTFFKLDQLGRLPSWGIPLVIALAITTASMLSAWRWETLGGKLTMLCAVTLGLAGGYATYTYANLLDVSGSLKRIVLLLAIAEWTLPFLIFGWLFVKVGRKTRENPA